MITPLGSEGGVHETVSPTISKVADKPDTGPGTVYMYINVNQAHMYSCINSTDWVFFINHAMYIYTSNLVMFAFGLCHHQSISNALVHDINQSISNAAADYNIAMNYIHEL